ASALCPLYLTVMSRPSFRFRKGFPRPAAHTLTCPVEFLITEESFEATRTYKASEADALTKRIASNFKVVLGVHRKDAPRVWWARSSMERIDDPPYGTARVTRL